MKWIEVDHGVMVALGVGEGGVKNLLIFFIVHVIN